MKTTPLEIIAHTTRVVARVTDRLTGDRADYPLLVAASCQQALKIFSIESHVLYGHAAWIEVLEDQNVIWAGCWTGLPHFWVETQFGETVDLTTSVAFRKKTRAALPVKPLYSPPILWSTEIPSFYRYHAEGAAEVDPQTERDKRLWETAGEEIHRNLNAGLIQQKEPEFIDEPFIGPDRKLLDDTKQTFAHFDRAIAVKGIPAPPF